MDAASGLDFSAFQHPLGHDALAFWADPIVQRDFPVLYIVALVVFGHPSSAAQIERDFGIASLLVTNKRSLLDVAWVDMILFLRANIDSIPEDVRKVSALPTCDKGPWYHARVPVRMRSAAEIRATMAVSMQVQSSASQEGADDGDLEQLAVSDAEL
jgi:hAT family C-terminal dimerisation region